MRYLPNHDTYPRMTTGELRDAFLLTELFVPGRVSLVFADSDRVVVGGAVPAEQPLVLPAPRQELAAEFFLQRRELGVVNIGGPGWVTAGTEKYPLDAKDMLYVARGRSEVTFQSVRASDPAVFYFLSFPAHADFPTTCVRHADAQASSLGSAEGANRRTIKKYIHPGGVRSCQLVMGLTDLEPGSVWNTMPPHTHARRMEVYLYFGMDPADIVVHLMGIPAETRSLVVRNRQAVLSPPWSIHCGAATRSYSFVWGMGGENQEFSDMDQVPAAELR